MNSHVTTHALTDLCRPVDGIEARSAQEVHDIMSARIRAALSVLPTPREGTIKSLKWEYVKDGAYHYARFFDWDFVIVEDAPGVFTRWGEGDRPYDTLDAAKSAAQAHYEHRILSALSFVPVSGKANVPEGWQLVPKEPTPEMVRIVERDPAEGGDWQAAHDYRDMLAVAPSFSLENAEGVSIDDLIRNRLESVAAGLEIGVQSFEASLVAADIRALLAAPVGSTERNVMADARPNRSIRDAVEALRYLSVEDRPIGGEQSFNWAHLNQIADELEGLGKSTISETAAREELAGETDAWKVVPDEMTNDLLEATTKGRQVLAYEGGRYYNAWLEFEQTEGGWLWFDDTDSEPNPSHYRELPPAPPEEPK
jgi:hypothetical protein